MATYEVVAGWTGPIDISILSRGDTPSGSMSGMTVSLILRDADGNALATSGDCSVADASAWTVRYTPDATDLTPGVYRGRFKLVDGSGGVVYSPSGEYDIWIVRSEA